jgi:hypothetical protein
MDYGTAVTFGTLAAPALFTGITKRWSLDDAVTEQLHQNMAGAMRAYSPHSRQRRFDFAAEVTSGSTDFLDLSSEAGAVVISDVDGTSLVEYCDEYWVSLAAKMCAIRGVNLPDTVLGSGTRAGVALSAFTPDQTSGELALPGTDIIYSTVGLTHAAGEVHSLRLSQHLTARPGKTSPDAKIKHGHSFGYLRRIEIEILVVANAAKPAVNSALAMATGTSRMANYRVQRSSDAYEFLGERMYRVGAIWIPPFG